MVAPAHRPIPNATALFAGLLIAGAGALSVTVWRRPLRRTTVRPAPVHFRVNVNHADAATLRLLPGVGEGLAKHIIAHRRRVGPFRQPADLQTVYMIGPTTRARLTPWVSFGRADPHATR